MVELVIDSSPSDSPYSNLDCSYSESSGTSRGRRVRLDGAGAFSWLGPGRPLLEGIAFGRC